MKKVLSYIIISFVILANILAPFGFQITEKDIKINTQTANAEYKYDLDIKPTIGSDTISLEIKIIEGSLTGDSKTSGGVTENINLRIRTTLLKGKEDIDDKSRDLSDSERTIIIEFKKLDPSTQYTTKIELIELISATSTYGSPGYAGKREKTLLEKTIPTPTLEKNKEPVSQEKINISGNSNTIKENNTTGIVNMPSCGIDPGTWFTGCLSRLAYYVLFVPTSYVFAIAGTLFDYVFSYTIQDSTYRSAFVVQGWGLVRDFCNIFFIFILLYIAIGTIVGLHGINYKNMIVNVVIVGLFINFSLFITQVFIDASNITARIFYNSDTIKVTTKGDTKLQEESPTGVISLSAALVDKVDPQNLVINHEKVAQIPTKSNSISTNSDNNESIGAGIFFVIVLLASIINIVGFIIFLSISLIFIARVVGLWIAMIFAPLAFFTYMVPSFKKWDTVGFDKWLPETLSMAFLAPVFIFLLYIILKFLDLNLIPESNGNGLAFIISVLLPFIIIMVLLFKAKDIAKKMSGSLGQQITGGIAALGGLALGGAALGGAALGRKFIGGGLTRASNNDTLSQKFMDPSKRSNMNFLQKTGGWIGSGFGTGYGINKIHDFTGKKLNEKQKTVNEIDHARHVTDEAIEKAGFKGKTWEQLSFQQRDKVLTNIKKENYTKHTEDTEREYRKANNLEKEDPVNAAEEAVMLKKIEDDIKAQKGYTPGMLLTAQDRIDAQKQLKQEVAEENKKRAKLPDLSSIDRKNIKDEAMKKAEVDFEKELHHAAEKVNVFNRAFSKANSGTYDLRNLSQIKSDKREGWGTKTSTLLASSVALGVRAGLKNGMNIDHGKGQGTFMKDLTTSLSEALKSINVKVEMPKSSGGGGGHDDHGGGHGGGHH